MQNVRQFQPKQQQEPVELTAEDYFPVSVEMERALLGAILLEPKLINEVNASLSVNDLYVKAHKLIFKAMIELASDGIDIDPVLIANRLHEKFELDKVGGRAYIGELLDGCIRTHSLKSYIKKIIDLSQKRALINASKVIAAASQDIGETSKENILHARRLIESIASRTETQEFTDIKSIAVAELNRIENLAQTGEPTGISSGLPELDRITTGFQASELTIVGARPSMGKTGFALSLAQNIAMSGKKVGFFSLEMPKVQLVNRLLASMAKVDLHRLRGGFLSRDEWRSLTDAMAQFQDWQMFIDDSSSINVNQLTAKARRIMGEVGLDILFIDYLQIIHPAEKHGTREQAVTEISNGVRALSRELRIPIVCLCQTSRKSEERPDKRPTLADLRESGSIEADADNVVFIFREEVYFPCPENEGIADIIVAKQRNGPTDTIKVAFIKKTAQFAPIWRD